MEGAKDEETIELVSRVQYADDDDYDDDDDDDDDDGIHILPLNHHQTSAPAKTCVPSCRSLSIFISTTIIFIATFLAGRASTFSVKDTSSNDEKDAINLSLGGFDDVNRISGISESTAIDLDANVREIQIGNYKQGNALLLNIHITHHAGTTLCSAMKQVGHAPEHACNGGDDWPPAITTARPWTFDETDRNALELRKQYHFISWEFGKIPKTPLEDVNWESPHLVSVIIMKDPILRRLSGDGTILKKFGKEARTPEQWQAFAEYDGSINFMLTRLTPDACGLDGENTTMECLETAKDLIRRFTYVLDVECLSAGMEALSMELGFTLPNDLRKRSSHPGSLDVSARERIGIDDVYDFIVKRNQRDTELYEWSKGLSLVNCSALDETSDIDDDDDDNNNNNDDEDASVHANDDDDSNDHLANSEIDEPDKTFIAQDVATTTGAGTTVHTNTDEKSQELESQFKDLFLVFDPRWFDRDSGWTGTTYLQAYDFCFSLDSRMPCPYEVYCPNGFEGTPLGGVKDDGNGAWAPIMNVGNAWVQIGKDNTCELYSDINGNNPMWGLDGVGSEDMTRHIACCLDMEKGQEEEGLEEKTDPPKKHVYTTPMALTDTEQFFFDTLHPLWLGRSDGYLGTTHEAAEEFCSSLANFKLCPLDAYCPNGAAKGGGSPPLFLQVDSFEGEQWAPVYDEKQSNSWVLVGTINDNPTTTCNTYFDLKWKPPQWGLDGSNTELKEHVLCCLDSSFSSTGIESVSPDEVASPGATEEKSSTGGKDENTVPNNNAHDDIRAVQIGNYKQGNALLLNIHITHHAGTTFCSAMKQVGHAPEHACNGGDDWPPAITTARPWTYDETDRNALELRKQYHFISWEFGKIPKTPLEDVNWESPHLVSVIIMKDPILRRLSGDGTILKKFGKEATRTPEQWQAFAEYDGSINFMLTRLTPDACGLDGENTTMECLEIAKDLIRRFTYVLDAKCLSEGMEALSMELGFTLPGELNKRSSIHSGSGQSARERIGIDDVYDFIVKRNQRDTELYEWSKGLSLVNCSALDESSEGKDFSGSKNDNTTSEECMKLFYFYALKVLLFEMPTQTIFIFLDTLSNINILKKIKLVKELKLRWKMQ